MKLTLLSIICLASCSSALIIPDGYLLVFKAAYSNHLSLFQVNSTGTVQGLWNFTLNEQHKLNNDNLFAVDTSNQLVYLGVTDQLLALSLTTGKVVINKPLLQPFRNYNYVAKDNAIYGVCNDNVSQWKWCRVKLGVPEVKLEFLYQLPGTGYMKSPTPSNLYYMDKTEQSFWYYIDHSFIHGISYTTGEEIFHGNSSSSDMCIAHDHLLNRTFTITHGDDASPILAELHPWPHKITKLFNLPPGIYAAFPGACDYDQNTHTLMLLLSSPLNYDVLPTQLLLIDVVGLSYKSVALPEFRKWEDTEWPATGVKYMKN